MANIKTQIKLSRDERSTLREYISSGIHSAKLIRRAQIILALDTSYGYVPEKESQIADFLIDLPLRWSVYTVVSLGIDAVFRRIDLCIQAKR
ncbi:MAG: hypothetical protein K0Q48_2559 [Bacillota bacterium]|nr:hypothetical protein [Bacillota bacterium]